MDVLVFFFAFVKLLCKVVFDTHFIDRVQLPFQVINMLFFVDEDLLKKRPGSAIADFGSDSDGLVEVLYCIHLQREIAFKLRLDVRANIDFSDVCHVRSPVEEENSVHQLLRMNHFFDGLLAIVSSRPEITPVVTHFAMQKILVDGG